MLDIESKNFFLNTISDYINQKNTPSPSDDFDWANLWRLAKNHEMAGIIYHKCKAFLPKNIIGAYEKTYSATLFTAANRAEMLIKIEETFARDNIESFTVKGARVADYYPLPALRTMGDTDIVMKASDRELAHELMLGLGFNCTRKHINSEWGYEAKGFDFELHDRLLYGESFCDERQAEFFNDCFSYVKDGELNPSFHFLFLLVHLRKHITNFGAGFRQFIDIALMCRNEKALDWDWIKEKLLELGLFDFAQKVFLLNEAWFNITPPITTNIVDEGFASEMTEYIFNNGIFGFQNDDPKKALEIGRKVKEDGKGLTLSSKLFPPYDEMIANPAYKSLTGKKFLLPIFWIYRLIRGLFGKHRRTYMHMLTKPAVTAAEVEEKKAFLKRWGINS